MAAGGQRSGQLERADVGAWLFKCNPKEWDIQAALRDGRRIDSWRVHENYRLGLIQPGDPAVLWVTGPAHGQPTPGIWAVGYTTREIFDDRGDDYWVNTEHQGRPALYAGLLMWPIDVVPRERITADPATANLEILRQPQMSNPSYLTPPETAALKALVPSWPTYT